jgi:hypothetical protein
MVWITSSTVAIYANNNAEYLIKQYFQTSNQEPIYLDMWEDSLRGIKKHLVTYTYPSNFTIIAERPWGLSGDLEPKVDHLVCFMPGTLALSVTGGLTVAELKRRNEWTSKKQEDLDLAIELMKSCWGMYEFTKSGLAPEITYFQLPPAEHGIKHFYSYDPHHKPNSVEFDPDPEATWREDFFVKPNDAHNLQRPETVESLFYLWRITGDEKYRQWGWRMFESFMKYSEAPDDGGYTSMQNVDNIPPPLKDNMESFWLVCLLCFFKLEMSQINLI